MTIWWLLAVVAFLSFAYYMKLPRWFYIPRDPWSPALESDMVLMMRLRHLPRFALRLYERNLVWRRNLSKNWERRRNGLPPMKLGPMTEEEVGKLEVALGRSLDAESRRLLMRD